MGKIKKLPKEVAYKIAAGEVIESPYNVVKELIENSIDANSTEIYVELKKSGKKEIKIRDNGEGMNKEDLKLSFKKHTTSKISKSEDLYDIDSLGFRGEALSSILEISKTQIISNNGKESHKLIKDRDGIKIQPSGRDKGTTIIVRDLFYNIPARKKHLKKKRSKLKKITNLIIKYSLIHKDIKFKLKNNSKIKLNLTDNNLKKRIIKLYGKEAKENLIKVNSEDKKGDYHFKRDSLNKVLKNYKFKGYITLPDYSKNTKDIIHLFVNKRPIKSKKLNDEIKKAYGRLLDKKNPLVVIFIESPKDKIDVNVHPKKEEVRFLEEDKVRKALFSVIRFHLKRKEYFKNVKKTKRTKREENNLREISSKKNNLKSKKKEEIKTDIKKKIKGKNKRKFKSKIKESKENKFDKKKKEIKTYQSERTSLNKENKKEKKWRYIGQFNRKYIIFENNKNENKELIIIDQHAAEERINYEKIKNKLNNEDLKKQKLISTKTLKLDPVEISKFEDNKNYFEELGFEIDLFGKDMIKVRSVPIIMGKSISPEIIKDLIDLIEIDRDVLKNKKEKVIKKMACNDSIKSGDELNSKYSSKLIKRLFDCEYPYTCPHGRPVIAKISDKNLEKTFFRTNKS